MTAQPVPAIAPETGVALGGWLQRGVIGAALLVLGTAALAVPLGWVGWWRPAAALPLLALLAIMIARLTRRLLVVRLETGPALGVLLVAVASGWWGAATHSSQVLPRRDAGSNLQAAIALAETGHRILAVPAASIGGPAILDTPGLTLASPAFFEVGTSAAPAIQPQFVIGPAALYSLGHWADGVGGVLILAPWFAALGVLAVGMIAAVVLRGWWGPIAAGGVAILFPVLHTARASYSEPLAMVTLGAGLLAWVLAARADDRRLALAAGILIGGTCLVRIDGLREAVLLLPVAALGIMQGRAWPKPLLLGTGVSVLLALGAALAVSNQYVGQIAASLIPLVVLGIALGLFAAVLIVAGRRGRSLPRSVGRSLPRLAACLALLGGVGLAARPLFMTVRQDPADPGARVVAGLQQRQGLPVDGGRTYAEHTVDWLAWWVGPVALVLALAALAGLAAHLANTWARGQTLPAWTGPYVVAAASTVLTLWRPGITPDHPWAERRLLIALPFVVLLVTAAAAWLWRGAGGRLRSPMVGRSAAVLATLALVIPSAMATWPHRSERVERGSLSPVFALCSALEPGDVVLAVDSRAANEWPQVIRGMCARPALSTTSALRADPGALRAAADRIAAGLPQGGRLVLLAADSPAAITGLGGTPHAVASAEVLEDDRLLEERPEGLVPLRIDVWLAPYGHP